jgi:hypothetical protein
LAYISSQSPILSLGVTLAPGIAGARVSLDDDRGNAELPEARAEPDGALAAADDEDVGLRFHAELLRLLVAQFLPGLGAGIDAVPGAERPGEAGLLLMAFQLGHRREQGPDEAVLEADEAVAARDFGLERYPGFEYAVSFRRRLALGDAPIARLRALEAMGEHVADLTASLHRLDVPGERDEVAPIALFREHPDRLIHVARGQRHVEIAEKGLNARIGRRIEHRFLPIIFIRRPPDGLVRKNARVYPRLQAEGLGLLPTALRRWIQSAPEMIGSRRTGEETS